MATSFSQLVDEYDTFLRNEKYNLVDLIATAVSAETLSSKSTTSTTINPPRLTIPFGTFRSQGNNLSERIRTDPNRHLRALEEAAHRIALEESSDYEKLVTATTTTASTTAACRIKVSISGPIYAAPSSPRQLTSTSLRQLVSVEGVATKVSMIKPKVVSSAHYCPATNQISRRDYVDATDAQLNLPRVDAATGEELPDRFITITTSMYPTKDDENNPLETEYGLSIYKDHQTICLQEMPEKAPLGQLPRSVELLIDYDLVDRIKPGDRVMITGVYRALATKGQQSVSHHIPYSTAILVNHVQIMGRNVHKMTFRTMDIPRFRALGKRDDVLEILGHSVAPSIHGHECIKKAIALQLLSGVEKNLENGTHLRGDVNILMVGDPSTAKSQLLRAAMAIAPLAVSTTGKGSSGVGLTAAVTTDVDTRERRLEAGAMVLADRGIVCIDEFDKMSEADRVAIHEAMEQQTVTIAKAGIHASLNARCAVLAAANPVYGQYDKTCRVTENIGLPDSLLSRFDLLFVVLDQLDPELDREIAMHVLKGHRSRYNGMDNYCMSSNAIMDETDADAIDNNEESAKMWRVQDSMLTLDFLRKYIHYAKNRRQTPILTDVVREAIAVKYAELRAAPSDIAVTARTLETMIRLSTAHAKARLSDTVDLPDVNVAIDIMKFALFHETGVVANDAAAATKNVDNVVDDDDAMQVDNDAVQESENIPPPSKKRARLDDVTNAGGGMTKPLLQRRIWEILGEHEESITMTQLEKELPGEDLTTALELLKQDGQIEVSNGIIYKY